MKTVHSNNSDQDNLNKLNAEFWNELCGTGLAQHVGIKDNSKESLKKFDDAYFDIYPYLLEHVKPEMMKGKKVLEIGLGYGSLSQAIAESGADYYGLDIAQGPVNMVNHRLNFIGSPENARQGNMLECPFDDETFDGVVSIGCFHHTGDVQRCFDETYRILKPGGRAVLMVYNRYSVRQWVKNFGLTFRHFLGMSQSENLHEAGRAAYDATSSGAAAPDVHLSSISELKKMLNRFSKLSFQKENIDVYNDFPLFMRDKLLAKGYTREKMLGNVGKWMGLDVYIECIK